MSARAAIRAEHELPGSGMGAGGPFRAPLLMPWARPVQPARAFLPTVEVPSAGRMSRFNQGAKSSRV